ncbi:MAG: DUF1593 domain-containing protein [Blastocatellia bacterium]
MALLAVTLSNLLQPGSLIAAPVPQKPRVVVTADPELDDSNSLVRYLLYSTDFQTEGIVYTSSGFHWKGDGTGKKWFMPNREYRRFGLNLCPCESWRWDPKERFIDDAVEIYEKVYQNLRVHNKEYPTPAEMKAKIRWGNVEFDGDISKETPGSDLIKALLLDNRPEPIYLLAWGGQSTIARALKSIHDQYKNTPQWSAIYQKVTRKAILSTSGDQDDTGKSYIQPNWPDIKTLPIGGGGVPLAYNAVARSSAENLVYYSAEWTRKNISSRGAFGAFYRVWGDGKQMVKDDFLDYFGLSGLTAEQLKAKGYIVWTPPREKGSFIAEGDTFTYLNLLDNGLLGYQDETLGGWAGDGVNSRASVQWVTQNAGQGSAPASRPVLTGPNFTPAAQNGLAARLQWSVTPRFAEANHEPRVSVRGNTRISARAGETIKLQGLASDPDKNAVAVKWWQWKEVDTYPGQVTFSNPAAMTTSVQIPTDAIAGQTIHLIFEGTDNGTPALTRYKRVVITVKNDGF